MTPSKLARPEEQQPAPDRSIARLATARTAFVGRTLRGPVDRPVPIKSFGEFQHVFGGLWQPAPLGYAVEQFFDNGGRDALIVRVANGARAATLTLNAGNGVLKLRAQRPGTREFLRASVDYDNIPDADVHHFNLTIQRVRAQGTSQVDDQEIFRRASLLPNSPGYFLTVIAQSQLATLVGDLPPTRPDETVNSASGVSHAYIASNADGDDGAPLSDYDLIGSEAEGRGLFALSSADYFNFLCIPPLSREHDVGPCVLLAAERYCRKRRALLIVDPPAHWHTADDALRGLRDWDLTSENALMYFPRVLAHDKLRGHFESFAPCGAAAGMLSRNDEIFPLWNPERNDEAVLRPGYRPTCLVSDERRNKLAAFGVNTIQGVRSAAPVGPRPRTLAAGNAGSADWQFLSPRRLALFILNSIERGTRWTAARPALDTAEQVTAQVRGFLENLFVAGAFGGKRVDDAFFVLCDERVRGNDRHERGFQFVIGFTSARRSDFHSFRITHGPSGADVEPVSLNRWSFAPYSPAELDWVDQIARQLNG